MKYPFKKWLAPVLGLLCHAPFLNAQIPKTMLRLPDTGQMQGFTNTPGEDADYSIHPPYFLINGNGTVTDTVTGLMWEQSDGGEMTIENATIYCKNLRLGGYDNWRLPTAKEAYSILNQGKSNPALDPATFPNTGAEYWWTAEQDVTNPNKIWVTNRGGGIGNHLKTETISAGGTKKIHVRAVRDVQAPGLVAGHFLDQGDGTVTDLLTQLVWQRTPAPDSMNWENALVYSENLSLAGANDWRLPNIKELQSLTDANLANPCVNKAFFPTIGTKKYWSGTSLPNQTTRAWYLDTRFGITTYAEKSDKLNILCVRGGQDLSVKTDDPSGENLGLLAYPNPFNDRIHFNKPPENAIFKLTNAIGQIVFFGKDPDTVDFSDLPEGIYFLSLEGINHSVQSLIKLNH